jgi:glycosyltransferase involved in cell wall biosynthesis
MKKLAVHVGSGVVPIPPPKGGSIEKLLWEFSKLGSKDIELAVVDNKDGPAPKGFIHARARRLEGKLLLRLTELLFGLRAREKIGELSKARPVSVVHCHTVFTALPFALFGFPGGTKSVYTCHNPVWTAEKSEADLLNRLVGKVEKLVMKKFDCVTTETPSAAAEISRKCSLPEGKVKVVTSFLDFKEMSGGDRAYFRKKYGARGPVVMFLSKLNRIKGVDVFLKAASLVKAEVPEATFVVAGPASFEGDESDAAWRSMAEELGLGDSVIFTGAIPEKELPDAYASADVFCLPTRREVFGLVVAEAMAAGLPVVVSDIAALREVTGGLAAFARREDHEGFAMAIIGLLKSRKKRKKMSKKLQSKAKEYDKAKVLADFLKLYSELLAAC